MTDNLLRDSWTELDSAEFETPSGRADRKTWAVSKSRQESEQVLPPACRCVLSSHSHLSWEQDRRHGARPGTQTILIAVEDLTERKQAQEELEKNESTIRALLDSATQSVVAVSADRKIVLVNGNTEKMFGYSREELLGQPLEMLLPESAQGRHVEHHRAYFANMQSRPMGMGLNLEGRRKDSTQFFPDLMLIVPRDAAWPSGSSAWGVVRVGESFILRDRACTCTGAMFRCVRT